LKGCKKIKLIGIPKLEDANDAGSRHAEQCTLILTEGDSAKVHQIIYKKILKLTHFKFYSQVVFFIQRH